MGLTDEQKKLADDNHRLAFKFAGKNRAPFGMDHDEWISECLYCLLRAAKCFKPELGFSFVTYAWRAMERGRWAVFQKNKQLKQLKAADSSDDVFDLEDVADFREQISQIEKMDAKQTKADLDGLIRSLPADLRLYMRQRAKGMSFRDMSREWGVSRQALQQRAGHARQAMLAVAKARGIDLG